MPDTPGCDCCTEPVEAVTIVPLAAMAQARGDGSSGDSFNPYLPRINGTTISAGGPIFGVVFPLSSVVTFPSTYAQWQAVKRAGGYSQPLVDLANPSAIHSASYAHPEFPEDPTLRTLMQSFFAVEFSWPTSGYLKVGWTVYQRPLILRGAGTSLARYELGPATALREDTVEWRAYEDDFASRASGDPLNAEDPDGPDITYRPERKIYPRLRLAPPSRGLLWEIDPRLVRYSCLETYWPAEGEPNGYPAG